MNHDPEPLTEEQRRAALLKSFETHRKVKAEGFAGVLPNGNIVDRRQHPEAIPMQKNSLLGIPAPQPLPNRMERNVTHQVSGPIRTRQEG